MASWCCEALEIVECCQYVSKEWATIAADVAAFARSTAGRYGYRM